MNQRDKKKSLNNIANQPYTYKYQLAGTLDGQNITQSFDRITENQISNVICFSHLRWNFVFQRPQHLLTRWSRDVKVYYFEEPQFGDYDTLSLKETIDGNVTILTPNLKYGMSEDEIRRYVEILLLKFIKINKITDFIAWYYTPMALTYTKYIKPSLIIYDCMDELSGFKGAHPDLRKNERLLMNISDVVFTGGYHLYEHKKDLHENIYPFPSSIDQEHFESGKGEKDPYDQKNIPHPRVGFYGVIDERLDIELLDKLALATPDFNYIMIGPVVKIAPETLPKHSNIYYLGQKSYKELPSYLSNWDIAILPFAKNESTEFISPTKTPEYLAAGKPVVSTSIKDVVKPYGEDGLVQIADTVDDFAYALKNALIQRHNLTWKKKVSANLRTNSWDLTYDKMRKIVGKCLMQKVKIEKDLFQLNLTNNRNTIGWEELKNSNNEAS
ncbi:MAG TPA: glycosyltransferase [Lentimicrobium sp.]|nr:glycosyltransferase [Lentimicrobium sp.]